MSDNHRLARILSAVILGLGAIGLSDAALRAQDAAPVLSAGFRKAAERVRPALVAVRPVGVELPVPFDPGRFGPTVVRPLRSGPLGDEEGRAVCSGVIVDAEHGQILTTDHPLQGASQVVIIFADGRQRVSSRIRRDPQGDLAVVEVDSHGLNLTAITWGDAHTVEPGDWVLALGRPHGPWPTMSAGILSARRWLGGEPVIETDAVIAPVNSGGPLVNLKGEVIGINRVGASRQDPLEGMSYAIPGDRARRMAADLARFDHVRRSQIGVRVEPIPLDATSPTRREPPVGVLITAVEPGSPAAEAGLRAGDVLTQVGGRPIDGVAALRGLVELAPLGEELTLTLERQGQRSEVKVRPREMPRTPEPLGSLPRRGRMMEARRVVPPRRVLSQPLAPESTPQSPAPAPAPGRTDRPKTTSPEKPAPQPDGPSH